MKTNMDIVTDILGGEAQNIYSNFDSSKLITFFDSFDSSQIWDSFIKLKNNKSRLYGYGTLNKVLLHKKELFNVGDLYVDITRIKIIKDMGFDQFVGYLDNNLEFWFQPEWKGE